MVACKEGWSAIFVEEEDPVRDLGQASTGPLDLLKRDGDYMLQDIWPTRMDHRPFQL